MLLVLHEFFLLCVFATLSVTQGALFFKQKQTTHAFPPAANVRSEATTPFSEKDPSTAGVLHITMPQRLPKLHEEIIFDVPLRADPLTLRVDRVYEHPATRSSTVCGHIIDTSSSSLGGEAGTFTLACQATATATTDSLSSSLTCLANLRPINADSIQYELRQNSQTKTHTLAAVNRNKVYEPKVVAGDQAGDLKHIERLAKVASAADSHTVSDTDPATTHVSRRLATDTNDIFDLFVVWTPEAEAVAGSANAMSLYMDLVIDEANYVLESSAVELRLRIVHSMRTVDGGYTEPGTDLGVILDQATEYSGTGKPEFDTEQGMRYTYQADALVVIAGSTAGSQCGIAWLKSE
jgi:hypothetical protein